MITPSASTLGAPKTPLPIVLDWLQGNGFPGIELRLAPGEAADPGQSPAARESLRRDIEAAGVAVTSVASYVKVAAAGNDDDVIADLIEALDFANDVGAPMVRVFPGAETLPGSFTSAPVLVEARDEVDERAARRLSAITGHAESLGVLPVLETHDSHPTGADISRILERVEGSVGVVWDLLHPWRTGEPLEVTWAALEPWMTSHRANVQIKDAALPASLPVPLGEGNLPLEDFGALLVNKGYDGTVTLEWEKAWYPEAAGLDVALKSARLWLDRHWPGAEK